MTSIVSSAARRAFPRGLLYGLLLLLSACASSVQREIPSLICPATGIVRDTGVATRFVEGSSYTQDEVLYTAYISDLAIVCDEEGDEVVSTVAFDVSARKGPASSADQVSLPYYVAVVQDGSTILTKQVYNAIIDLSDGRGNVREQIVQRLTLDDPQDTRRYEILIGFQLSDDELYYNLSQ